MITLEKSKLSWTASTFLTDTTRQAFQKKYKGWSAKLVIESGEGRWFNLIEDESLVGIVTDWLGAKCTLSIKKGEKYSYKYTFRQPPALCSTVYLTSPTYLNPEIEEFFNDFLYLMGYTNVMISIRYDQHCLTEEALEKELPKWGYTPYMKLNNRRTQSELLLYTKTLKAWLF